MSTLTKAKKTSTKKSVAKTESKLTAPKTWIGSGKGKARIAAGVYLNKPTYVLGQ